MKLIRPFCGAAPCTYVRGRVNSSGRKMSFINIADCSATELITHSAKTSSAFRLIFGLKSQCIQS